MCLMCKSSLLWVNCVANHLMGLSLISHLSSISLPLLSPLLIDTVNFLGISIVGQTSEDGAGGIFVGSVMKG